MINELHLITLFCFYKKLRIQKFVKNESIYFKIIWVVHPIVIQFWVHKLSIGSRKVDYRYVILIFHLVYTVQSI